MNVICPECKAKGAVPGTPVIVQCPNCRRLFPPSKNERSTDDRTLDEFQQ